MAFKLSNLIVLQNIQFKLLGSNHVHAQLLDYGTWFSFSKARFVCLPHEDNLH